jgi:hypothetical protein
MFQKNKNKFLAAIVMLLALSCMSFLADDNKSPEVFKPKNLKVLPKDITHDELIELMKGFNQSLGVKCVFCHVNIGDKWDFASDEKKEKSIARKMFKMAHAINKKYFGVTSKLYGTVTCMTCHQGGTEPKGKLN